MNKKFFLLFFLLLAATGLCRAQGGQLISSTCMADGVEYGTNLPVPTASTLTFTTVNGEITGYWAVSAETADGRNVVIAKSDENMPSAGFVLDAGSVDWESLKVRKFYRLHAKHMPGTDYAEYGYGLNIEFISTQDELDNTFVIYRNAPRVLPEIPQLTGIHFVSEDFDPQTDTFTGELTFEIDCENATDIWVEMYCKENIPYFTVDEWRKEKLSVPTGMFFEADDVVDGHMTYTHRHSWGDVILVRGINKEGSGVYTAPIFTADYITDPAALSRLRELHNTVGTGIASTEDLRIVRSGASLVAVADGDAVVTLEVIGIDGAKRATAAGRGRAAADLTQLAPGVYVARASDGHNAKTIKAMINHY